jgi:8-oxo-dGTP diphosphatase
MKPAVVLVLRDGDRVLAIQRAEWVPRGGWWSLPSGRIEPGETAEDALRREAREELGIAVDPLREVWRCPTDDGTYLLHWWLCAWRGGALQPDPGEVARHCWVDADGYDRLRPGFTAHRAFFQTIWPGLLQER